MWSTGEAEKWHVSDRITAEVEKETTGRANEWLAHHFFLERTDRELRGEFFFVIGLNQLGIDYLRVDPAHDRVVEPWCHDAAVHLINDSEGI